MEKPVKPVRLQFQHQSAGLDRAAVRPAGRRQFQGSTGNILALRNGSTSVLHTSHSPLFTLFPIKFSDWEPVRVTGPTTASRLSQNLSLFVAPKHQTDVFFFLFSFRHCLFTASFKHRWRDGFLLRLPLSKQQLPLLG